ncbi:GNAT family N-acetyltransferase [Neptunicoccus sediminis]|uniref:GNAT family N-acetyltransferase n=1 Tax=Neptunicoccus sediminis TaxID=1892596 RepID=UPI000845EF42|nr:N-acetyltransferase [Neptunicoccus sediminis]
MFQLSPETESDRDEVEFLYDLCFAPGREALSSYRLREGVSPVAGLCLVARDDYNVVAGAIRYWPVVVGTQRHAALLLGPVAVHPTYQGEGLGGLLIRDSLDRAVNTGWARVILVGDAPYYRKFGFEKSTTMTFPPPTNPDRLLYLPLQPDAFIGVKGMIDRAA